MDSTFKYLTFLDAYPVVKKANASKERMKVDDVPIPFENYNTPEMTMELDKNWHDELKKEKPSLLRAVYTTFKWELWMEGVITFLVCNLTIFDTVILGNTIKAITNIFLHNNENQTNPYFLVAIFSVSFILKILLENQYFFFNRKTGSSIKYSLTGFLYKKLNCISLTSLHTLDEGKAINLLTTDLNDIDHGLGSIWPMILCPYNVILPCYLMWGHFGFLSVAAFVIIFGCIQLTSKVTERGKGAKHEKNVATDARTKFTSELISCIRLIKLYAWEEPIKFIINKTRLNEVELLHKITANRLLNSAITETSIYLCVFSLCVLYINFGGIMAPEKVYATTALLNLIRRRVIGSYSQGKNFIVTF
jgi:ABC-type multidrug transport system fused ATPase/permease subunit